MDVWMFYSLDMSNLYTQLFSTYEALFTDMLGRFLGVLKVYLHEHFLT